MGIIWENEGEKKREWKIAKDFLQGNEIKLRRKEEDVNQTHGEEFSLKHSFIKIKLDNQTKIIALDHQENAPRDKGNEHRAYLGAGSSGRVKFGEDEEGNIYAVKIGALANLQDDEYTQEITTGQDVGLIFGTASRTSETSKKHDGESLEEKGYVLYEYLGESLTNFLKNNTKLSNDEKHELIIKLWCEVDAFHSGKKSRTGTSYAHLDIKPDNIVVKRDPQGNFQLSLIDVGLTKKDPNQIFDSEKDSGSPSYMQTESGGIAPTRSQQDIFSTKRTIVFPKNYLFKGASKTANNNSILNEDFIRTNKELFDLYYTGNLDANKQKVDSNLNIASETALYYARKHTEFRWKDNAIFKDLAPEVKTHFFENGNNIHFLNESIKAGITPEIHMERPAVPKKVHPEIQSIINKLDKFCRDYPEHQKDVEHFISSEIKYQLYTKDDVSDIKIKSENMLQKLMTTIVSELTKKIIDSVDTDTLGLKLNEVCTYDNKNALLLADYAITYGKMEVFLSIWSTQYNNKENQDKIMEKALVKGVMLNNIDQLDELLTRASQSVLRNAIADLKQYGVNLNKLGISKLEQSLSLQNVQLDLKSKIKNMKVEEEEISKIDEIGRPSHPGI